MKHNNVTRVATARVVKDGMAPIDGGAPRQVRRGLVRRLLLDGPWGNAAFAMTFLLLFLPHVGLITPAYDRVQPATITAVSLTGSDPGGPLYRLDYTYVDHRGIAHEGRSFSRAQRSGAATVEFVGDEPSESRIVNTRAWTFGREALLVVIFPLAMLFKCLVAYTAGKRTLRLLRHGTVTHGNLVDHTTEIETDNDSKITMHVLTFEYPIHDGTTHRTVIRTAAPGPLVDDALEPMVYDPSTPEQAVPIYDLPGTPRITADGTIEAAIPGGALHLLLLPLATLGFAIATAVAMVTR